jgi:FSR family fosmidomycin resistance protein-like MFS transporter
MAALPVPQGNDAGPLGHNPRSRIAQWARKDRNVAAVPEVNAVDRTRRTILGTCSGAHFIHDGFSDVLYLLLPLWQSEFGLSLAQVGMVRSLYSGAMATTQLPIGFLSERWGEPRLLSLGTAITALGFIALGLAGGLAALIALLLLAGAGSGAQHPLCASLVSKTYEGGPQRAALGIYNFSGDLGKMAVPLFAALIISELNWRASTVGYGTMGLLGALAILLILASSGTGDAPASKRDSSVPGTHVGWGIQNPRGFSCLVLIGILDSASRTAFLTFLPFLLIDKGADVETVGLALALVFGGGAAGKFFCGFLAERLGIVRTVIVTEMITCGGIALLLPLPLVAALALLPLVGLGLNGTSSVLYGSVAEFLAPERRSRGFSLFYTLGIGAGAVSPFLFGSLGDRIGVEPVLAIIAALVLIIVPLAFLLRGNSHRQRMNDDPVGGDM